MAIESVEANAGSGGATFAVDTITGSVQVPYVKLMSGADAAEDLIGGDAANGLDVDVTRVGGTVTVTGTVTADLGATDNAVLDAIAASLALLDNSIASGNELQVDVVAALPAGTNNIGDVDVASIAAGDNNIGNVDIASIAAGDAVIGRVKLSDGTDVADILDLTNSNPLTVAIVDGDGTQITSFGGGTQYTEDAAAAANPVGTALNLIRADSLAGVTTTDGDNVAARGTDKGELYVKHVDALTVSSHAVTNAGTFAVQVDGSALTALQLIDDAVHADDAAFTLGTSKGVMAMGFAGTQSVNANDAAALACETDGSLHIHDGGNSITVDGATLTTIAGAVSGTEMQVDVVAALPAGTNAIGKLAANSGVDIGDVDVTSISAGTNAIGNVGLVPRTSGGMTIFRSIDIDETEEEIKATAGQVFSITAFNRTAAPLYLKFYNATAANTTVGTTTPVLTFVVPANADSDGAGFVWNNAIGFAFGTAITVACTTAVADNDTGAPGANDCIVNVGYA